VVEGADDFPKVALSDHGAEVSKHPVIGADRKCEPVARTAVLDPDCVKTVLNDMILQRFGGGFDDALCRWRRPQSEHFVSRATG
jgi:hypothetical protein